MSHYLTPLIMVVVFVVVAFWATREGPRAPRGLRSFNRVFFWYALVVAFVWSGYVIFQGGPGRNPWIVWYCIGSWWLLAISQGYIAFFKRQTDQESGANYGEDPRHCGRCQYDLTGNESGICPECGWKIPGPSHQWQRAQWAVWWKGWRITYLDDWRKSLMAMVMLTLVFAALAGSVVWRGYLGLAIPAALLSIHALINSVRVIDYARRKRASSCPADQGDGDGRLQDP